MYLSQCRLLMVVTAATLLCAREARPAAILYYTGDSNGQAAYGNYQDLSGKVNIPESQVFENFIVAPGAPWNVTSLFVNCLLYTSRYKCAPYIRSPVEVTGGEVFSLQPCLFVRSVGSP